MHLGLVKAHLGMYDEASAYGQAARDFYQGVGWLWGGHLSLRLLGWVALTQQDWASAQEMFRECMSKSGEVGARDELAPLRAWQGYAFLRAGDLEGARRHLCTALRTASEIGNKFQLVEALAVLALFLSKNGDGERAVELYALASSYPFVANSRWFEDMIGDHIATTTATLAADLVAAAGERGRARDLWDTAAEFVAELEDTGSFVD
jgi:tetratricopeptide (TPR) repeat protein